MGNKKTTRFWKQVKNLPLSIKQSDYINILLYTILLLQIQYLLLQATNNN